MVVVVVVVVVVVDGIKNNDSTACSINAVQLMHGIVGIG